MTKEKLKIYEKQIKATQLKIKGNKALCDKELKISEAITLTANFLAIFDEVEGTYLAKIFYELFLNSRNSRKTMEAIAMDIGFSRRSVIRHKNKIMQIFALLYEKRVEL